MSEQSILQILLGEFRDKLAQLQGLVERDARFPEAPNKINVAIGMRRAGKTYFLYQKILKLIEEGVNPTAILYINFEDDRLLPLNEQKLAKLAEAFYSLYPENHDRKCYLFFDEIQNVENWPIVIRRLHDTKNAEIFLTGSSAKLLSKEIATSLRGRSLPVEIWPYSFHEFMRAKNVAIDRSLYDAKTQDKLKQLFRAYLSEGGFPEIIGYASDVKQKTLQEYLDVVIYRDIIERHNVKNPTLIKYMILSMIHNVGKPFAVNKFYNDLKSQGYQIGKDTLYEYADHIEDAYLAFSVPIFDKSLRKAQTTPKKLYAIDPGMARALTLDYESDLGRLFENVVYLDLQRHGYKISYYHTEEGYEIDFLAQTSRGQKKLFQVAWDVHDAQTLEREKRALEAGIKELKVEGEIITLDEYLQQGIRVIT
jgi:predicted AAA+ superfamily ATPase